MAVRTSIGFSCRNCSFVTLDQMKSMEHVETTGHVLYVTGYVDRLEGEPHPAS